MQRQNPAEWFGEIGPLAKGSGDRRGARFGGGGKASVAHPGREGVRLRKGKRGSRKRGTGKESGKREFSLWLL